MSDHHVGCTGKRAWESFPVAQRMADNTNRHRETGGGKVAAYKCRHCAWFHVGESRRVKRPRVDLQRLEAGA